jgi:uncharacterized UPF0160 family protein
MITVATHSGPFHADDVFAVAALQLLLGAENMRVVRTRDEVVIAAADYAVDVGEVYDHAQKRYDHHQPGAPVRENGIPYAGFGLMWRHYGAEICGSEAVAAKIELSLCQPIDAGDNAVQIWDVGQYDLEPLVWDSIIKNWRALSYDAVAMDERFLEAVGFARRYLELKIAKEKKKATEKAAAEEFYAAHHGESILVSDTPLSRQWFVPYEEVQVIVSPRDESVGSDWMAIAVQESEVGFATRVRFPETWAGLLDVDLAKVSGLADAVFCHKDRYMCIFKSRESALTAAQLAD